MSKLEELTGTRLEETKRVARVLQIIQLISSQPRVWTRARLAQQFELSERMIDKDIDLIRNGLRYELKHKRDGYYFTKSPTVKPVQLLMPEALALALAAQQAEETGTVDRATLASSIARLESALPREVAEYLLRTHRDSRWPVFEAVRERGPILTLIERAQVEGRKLRIVYSTASRDNAHQQPRYRALHPAVL